MLRPGGRAGRRGRSAWPDWYASQRLLPYLRRAADAGALGPAHVRAVEAVIARIGELAGPAEPPSRIHGDCWSGNVLWSGGQGWLIDPAAHGGHRETDLAMLALFGAPVPGPDPGRLPRGRAAGARAGTAGCRCTSCTRCSCTRACSAPAMPRASPAPPAPPWRACEPPDAADPSVDQRESRGSGPRLPRGPAGA